jgi:hypothetical protein
MPYYTKIEFKKEEIKKFHYMIQHIQPLASELDDHDSDIWEYIMCRYIDVPYKVFKDNDQLKGSRNIEITDSIKKELMPNFHFLFWIQDFRF